MDMTDFMLKDIPNNLAVLIANLHPGEVIQIVSGNQIVARWTGEREPLHSELLIIHQPGSAIRTLKITTEDDKHIQDFVDYMP